MATRDVPEIAEEFPGWTAWESVGARQLHARQGSTMLVVHDDTLDGLRGQIARCLALAAILP